MKLTYVVVFEQTHNSYSAYPPDLPGCISAGDTWQDIQAMVREAIALYIEEVRGKRRATPRTANVT